MTDERHVLADELREVAAEQQRTRAENLATTRKALRLYLWCGWFALAGNLWSLYDRAARHDLPGTCAVVPVVAVLVIALWLMYKVRPTI